MTPPFVPVAPLLFLVSGLISSPSASSASFSCRPLSKKLHLVSEVMTGSSSSAATSAGDGNDMSAAVRPPPLRIYLARHGQDEDNAAGILNGHRDMPLTEIGVGQARTVAGKVSAAGLKFDAVYASPLQRAFRTAEIICDGLRSGDAVVASAGTPTSGDAGPSPIRLDDLIERDFGTLTGTPTSEIARRCGKDVLRTDTITYFLSPSGAETFPDLLDRARRFLARVRDDLRPGGGTVLLVTHGDFGKMLYASYYGLGWEDVLRKFHFGNSEILLLSEESSAEEAHVFEIDQHNH